MERGKEMDEDRARIGSLPVLPVRAFARACSIFQEPSPVNNVRKLLMISSMDKAIDC